MFDNYKLGVTISPIECNADDVTDKTTDRFLVKDSCNNIVGLRWSPVDRFILKLTPDIINKDSTDTISISIYNFRGESIFDYKTSDVDITINVDDTLSGVLVQGFYYIDICRCTDDETLLLKRLSLSVDYDN